MLASDITAEERKMMEDFLKRHPIDPTYDEECEYFDGKVPEEQLLSRDFKKILDENPE